MVGVFDLHFDLQSAFLPVGFRRDLGHVSIIDFPRISFGRHPARLSKPDFGEIGFIEIDLHLQILRIGDSQERGAGTLVAPETLRRHQFILVGQFLEDNTVDGGADNRPRQVPSRKVQ